MNSLTRIEPLTLKTVVRSRAKTARLFADLSLTRAMMGLAVGSLLLAGCFSLLLVIGRLPIFSSWVTDPLFFRRCLVLHVDLALVVWFFSFAAGLYSLLPADRASNRQFRAGLWIAAAGCLAMIAGTMVPGSAPVLANYVPVIDNRIYVGGVWLFFWGLLVCFINDRLFISASPSTSISSLAPSPDVAVALKAVAVAYLLAITTFLISCATTPRDLEARAYYELIFWGGGHVLQVANVAAMLAVWLHLLAQILKRPILRVSHARILFALLVAPHFVAPLLAANSTMSGLYRQGFTRLMQFGIAPVTVIVLALCTREMMIAWRRKEFSGRRFADPSFIGFAASAALTITGFCLGAAIRNSTTMIPAHYHASIGAVTAAFMAVTYLLMPQFGLHLQGARDTRLIRWQLAAFGAGQVIFAIGFALGGMHGLSRKAYGAEQHIRSWGEMTGLAVMGGGGVIAILGGLLFLWLILRAVANRAVSHFAGQPNLCARTNP